ncbi:probable nucleolar protein 5-2 [Tanacetum coccineum]|uniref:Probable nucleolar protein 5-2 n=1 Tax=Tanacetum coccineum TaxID=301880 RepID=A0ABQ5H637_9ASTR
MESSSANGHLRQLNGSSGISKASLSKRLSCLKESEAKKLVSRSSNKHLDGIKTITSKLSCTRPFTESPSPKLNGAILLNKNATWGSRYLSYLSKPSKPEQAETCRHDIVAKDVLGSSSGYNPSSDPIWTKALTTATLVKPSKGLCKVLKSHCDGETLAVADSKHGNVIKEKLLIDCVHNQTVMELTRGVRSQLTEVITGLGSQDLAPMSLGLSHSLSRHKLKLLDDLDKELNTYAVRVCEWYGWHFPELANIVQDNIHYAKAVKLMGKKDKKKKYKKKKEVVAKEVNVSKDVAAGEDVKKKKKHVADEAGETHKE